MIYWRAYKENWGRVLEEYLKNFYDILEARKRFNSGGLLLVYSDKTYDIPIPILRMDYLLDEERE